MRAYGVKLERSSPLSLARHSGAPDDAAFTQWSIEERRSGRRLAVDLFSGAGGLGLGVEAAGWTVAAAVDNDRQALNTHRANFRGQALDIDMSSPIAVERLIAKLKPLEIDLIAGGPPCQPFSRAGRAKIQSLVDGGLRNPVDARKELWRSYVDVVLALRPRAVLMENVPDMAIGDDLVIVREVADLLERAGYDVDYRLLDAWRYGVPQHRKRFFLQARNDGIGIRWPTPVSTPPNVRDAIGDLPALNGTTGGREQPYHGVPSSALAIALRGPDDTGIIYDHMTRPVRDDDKLAFALMDSSTLYSQLPENLRRYRSDTFDDKYKRLGWEELSRTITAHIAKDGYWYIHPAEHRTLTVREAARIQTFPDSFRFAGTRSDAFRQIGNAVPPVLGSAVAASLLDTAPELVAHTPSIASVRTSLENWAMERSAQSWWLFPGPKMTRVAALFASLLQVTALSVEVAARAMEPLAGATSLNVDVASAARDAQLTPARQRAADDVLKRIQRGASLEDVELILRGAQLAQYRMLCGENCLITNSRVRAVLGVLMSLPADQRGEKTDVKVALAQLVGVGEFAANRMAAIRSLTPGEAVLLKKDAAARVHASAR